MSSPSYLAGVDVLSTPVPKKVKGAVVASAPVVPAAPPAKAAEESDLESAVQAADEAVAEPAYAPEEPYAPEEEAFDEGGAAPSGVDEANALMDEAVENADAGGDSGGGGGGGGGSDTGLAPDDASLQQATNDANQAAIDANTMLKVIPGVTAASLLEWMKSKAPYESSPADRTKSFVMAGDVPDVSAKVSKAQSAGKRAIELGKKAVRAGKVTAGNAAVAAGEKALAASGKLANAAKAAHAHAAEQAKSDAKAKAALHAPAKAPVAPPVQYAKAVAPKDPIIQQVEAHVQMQAPKQVMQPLAPKQVQVMQPVQQQVQQVSKVVQPLQQAPKVQVQQVAPLHLLRGDLPFILPSPLEGVSDEAWTQFALAVRSAPVGAVGPSNELGMFAIKPRRLADLGLVVNLGMKRAKNNRMVWVGDFVPPMTVKHFLSDPAAQYAVFADSMKRYVEEMRAKKIPTPEGGRPSDMSLSGALAVLHRCGPSGIKTWNNEADRFPDTVDLYSRTNGIF